MESQQVNWDHTWKTKTGLWIMLLSLLGMLSSVIIIDDDGWLTWTLITMIITGASGFIAWMWPTLAPLRRSKYIREIIGISILMISIILIMHLMIPPET